MNETESTIGTLHEVSIARHGALVSFYIAASEYDRVEALWGAYVDAGKQQDRKLEVECGDGDPLSFLLSDMITIEKSTREGRRRIRERDQAFQREKNEDGVFDG